MRLCCLVFSGRKDNPRTLIRAAKEMAEKQPRFALEAGMAALQWLARG